MKAMTSAGLPLIDFFDGTEYDFLSNFHPSPVTLGKYWQHDLKIGDINCPTVEHAFQAAKAMNFEQVVEIATVVAPGQAKYLGRKVQLRPDWEQIKVALMRDLVWQKFQREDLQEKLLATAPALLVEGNTWNDRFWGVCDGQGLNWLGLILMETRNQIMEKLR